MATSSGISTFQPNAMPRGSGRTEVHRPLCVFLQSNQRVHHLFQIVQRRAGVVRGLQPLLDQRQVQDQILLRRDALLRQHGQQAFLAAGQALVARMGRIDHLVPHVGGHGRALAQDLGLGHARSSSNNAAGRRGTGWSLRQVSSDSSAKSRSARSPHPRGRKRIRSGHRPKFLPLGRLTGSTARSSASTRVCAMGWPETRS
jgi:hypothetical protein